MEKKRIGNLVVPRGLGSCSHLRIKNPVLFVASTRSFLVRYPATLFVEIHGDAAAHPVAERKHASKRRKHHKQQPSLIVTLRFVLALLSPPHWSSLAQFRPSAELPQLDGGSELLTGPPTTQHQSQRGLSRCSVLIGATACRSEFYGPGEGWECAVGG